ncbi:MAG: phage portal protein [Planctomycetota bacterium]
MGFNFTQFAKKTSETVDSLVSIVSTRAACQRKAFRNAYEILDRHRTRTKRSLFWGTGDATLDERSLSELREIARDLSRNNPVAIGLLRTERDSVIGSGPKVEARSDDISWNADTEAAYAETMLDRPCDVTGRFNAMQLMRIGYLSYRRDGDAAILFGADGLQGIEGDQIGTPYGKQRPDLFEIVNGVAYSKKTRMILGYYIGQPNKWGYIQPDTWQKYPADKVHHIFNPERISFSRGEPVLTPSIKYLDYLTGYIDAELVAAKVNACFSMFVSQQNGDIPGAYTQGVESTGLTDQNFRHEKLEPGTIMYGQPGEQATGIGQTRPGALFDPFIQRILTIIGRPLCIPLMLITLDYSGATFMNARIAYQKAQEMWEAEQNIVIRPLASRIWLWGIRKLIDSGRIKEIEGWNRHEVFCKRWPYVDPYKEAIADEQQLKNATTTRTAVCARQGTDFADIVEKLAEEKKMLDDRELSDVTAQTVGKIQITN